jgi:hypothetical protein
MWGWNDSSPDSRLRHGTARGLRPDRGGSFRPDRCGFSEPGTRQASETTAHAGPLLTRGRSTRLLTLASDVGRAVVSHPRDVPKLAGTKLEMRWLVYRASRTSLNRLWIGDSHASFVAGAPLKRFAITSAYEAVVWLGPRLMYSLSREGFPDPLLPELRYGLNLASTPIVLTAGEIDCRVHLVERRRQAGSLAFVLDYVQRASELRARLGAPHAFLLGPVPPSDQGPENLQLPRRGTLVERVAATRELEAELYDSVIRLDDPAISAVPLGRCLADPRTGELAQDLSLDGCHVNARGSLLVRDELTKAASNPAGTVV